MPLKMDTTARRRRTRVAGFLRKSKVHRLFFYKSPRSRASVDKGELVGFEEANLVSSLCANGKHAPVIDLDIPHHYIKSSTPGHAHLYLDVEMSWGSYKKLLRALLDARVIGQGYYDMAIARRMSQVRMPDVHKASSPKPVTSSVQRTDHWADSL